MRKVAILESTTVLRLRLERILSKQGFTKIEYFSDQMIHLKIADSVFQDAALIIVDLDHSDPDPIALIQRIRQSKSNPDAPIIGLSQSSGVSTIKSALAAGCSDFILKPFTDLALVEKLHKWLNTSKPAKASIEPGISTEQPAEDANPSFNWSKDFEIGVPEIDADHSMIIHKFETLYQLMKEGKGHEYYQELLLFLDDYVDRHFEQEERFQLEISYDRYPEHKAIHDEFKARVSRIIEEHENKTATDYDLIRINLFIKDWLIHHILMEDGKIGSFFSAITSKD